MYGHVVGGNQLRSISRTSESRWWCGVLGIDMQYAFAHRARDIICFWLACK